MPRPYHFFQAIVICLLLAIQASAQPRIISVNPSQGAPGASITVNMTAVPANPTVYFAGVAGTITSSSGTTITVTVPAGAGYGRLTVIASGNTAYSPRPFNVISGVPLTNDSFTERFTAPAGALPAMIARGDFDRNGIPDMVVSNFGSSSVSVYLNRSTPGNLSLEPITITVPIDPEGIIVEDINADGTPDILVSSITGHSFAIIYCTANPGNSTVAFSGATTYSTNTLTWPRGLTSADMDGDGLVDIVTADNNQLTAPDGSSYGTFSISLLQFSGPFATFFNGAMYKTELYPRSVAVADLDGDNKPDVIVANNLSRSVTIYRNTSTPGNLSFGATTTISLQGLAEQLVLADMDGDGKTDVLVSEGNKVSVFRNVSVVGSIAVTSNTGLSGNGVYGFAVGDVDGDGKPDVAVPSFVTGIVSVYRNLSTSGSVSFAPPLDYEAGENPVDAEIGDMDLDGVSDIALTNSSTNQITILTLAAPPPVDLVHLGNDTLVCPGTFVHLEVNLPIATAYLWSTGETGPSIEAAAPVPGNGSGATSVWVAVTTPRGVIRDTIVIALKPLPVLDLGPDLQLCDGQQLTIHSPIPVTWQDNTVSTDFLVTEAGTYEASLSNECGTTTDEIIITKGPCGIYFPKAFTPNDDGINDRFMPGLYGALTQYKMIIYSRWGGVVFSSSDPSKGWDGMLNGKKSDAAVFVWNCSYQFAGKEAQLVKGVVTLIR